MDTYSNSQFPLLDSDMAEIEDIFINLIRQREERLRWASGDTPQLFNPPSNPDDLRSEWGIPY